MYPHKRYSTYPHPIPIQHEVFPTYRICTARQTQLSPPSTNSHPTPLPSQLYSNHLDPTLDHIKNAPYTIQQTDTPYSLPNRSVRVAERLALPTSDHAVAGSNPAGGEILSEHKRRFIAQSLSCSLSHRLEMTEILLKGRKTLTHPSIPATRPTPTPQPDPTTPPNPPHILSYPPNPHPSYPYMPTPPQRLSSVLARRICHYGGFAVPRLLETNVKHRI